MRVELIELLRCPGAHEPSALITVAHARAGDQLLDGTLGCPVCGASYPLRDGVVYFGEPVVAPAEPYHESQRLAALLGVETPSMRVGLCGGYAAAATALHALNAVDCVLINANEVSAEAAGAVHVDRARGVPLANASLHALAVDDTNRALLADAARVVRVGGRVIAPSGAPLPVGVTELARDGREWVASVDRAATDVPSAPIQLLRARRT